MLAAVADTRSTFTELARYLIHGPYGTTPSPKRVAWIMSRNLPTDDPALAAKIMGATAKLSSRVERPAYHAMIAWHRDEAPTPEKQQAIAEQTLELAGLADHEALIVGHGDTPHAHLHMLINRIHPVHGRAWKTSNDYARMDRIMKQLADAHGFRHVPAHAFNAELTDDWERLPDSPATRAARRGARTDRPQWAKARSRAFGEDISAQIDQAASWEDVEAAIAATGQRLEAKGQGLIVGDDASYSKFSALGLTTTAKGFEKKFGESFADFRARRPLVDAIDVVKGLQAFGLTDRRDVAKAVQEASETRQQHAANLPLVRQLENDLKRVLRSSTALQSKAQQSPRPSARSVPKSKSLSYGR